MHSRLTSRQADRPLTQSHDKVARVPLHSSSSHRTAERLAPLIETNPVLAAALGALQSRESVFTPTAPSRMSTTPRGTARPHRNDNHLVTRGAPRTEAAALAMTADPMLLSASAPSGNSVRTRFGGSDALQPVADPQTLLPSAVSTRSQRMSTMGQLRSIIRAMLDDPRTFGSVPTLLMEAYNNVVAAEAQESTTIDGNFFDVVTNESAAMIALRGSKAECASLKRELQRMESKIEDMTLDMHALRSDIDAGAKLLKAAEVDEQYAKQRLQEVEDRLQHTAKEFSLERVKVTRLQQQLQQMNQDEDRRFVARTSDLRSQLDASRDMLRAADDTVRNQDRELMSLKQSLDEQERQHGEALKDLDAAQELGSRLNDQVALLQRKVAQRDALIKRMDVAMNSLLSDAGKTLVTKRLAAIDGRWRTALQRAVSASDDNAPLLLNGVSKAGVLSLANPTAVVPGYIHLVASGGAMPKSVAVKPMTPAALNAMSLLLLCEIADPHRWRSKINDTVGHALVRMCKDEKKKGLAVGWTLHACLEGVRMQLTREALGLASIQSLAPLATTDAAFSDLNISVKAPDTDVFASLEPPPLTPPQPALSTPSKAAERGRGGKAAGKNGARSTTPKKSDITVQPMTAWSLLRDYPGLFEKRAHGGPVAWSLLLDAVLSDPYVEPCGSTLVGVIMEWVDEFLAWCAEAEATELAEAANPSTTEFASISAMVTEIVPPGGEGDAAHPAPPVTSSAGLRSRRASAAQLHHADIAMAASEPGTPVKHGQPQSALVPFGPAHFAHSPSMPALAPSGLPPALSSSGAFSAKPTTPTLRGYISTSGFWRVLRNFFTDDPSRRLRPHQILRLRGIAATDEGDAPIIRYRALFALKREGMPSRFADAFVVSLLQCLAGYDAAVRRVLKAAIAEECGTESPSEGINISIDVDSPSHAHAAPSLPSRVPWSDRYKVAYAWAAKWAEMDPARTQPAASPFSQSARGEAHLKLSLLGPAPTATSTDAFAAVRACVDSLDAAQQTLVNGGGEGPMSFIGMDDFMLHLRLGVRAVQHTNTNAAHALPSELSVPFAATISAVPWLRLSLPPTVRSNASFVQSSPSQNEQAWHGHSDVPEMPLSLFGPDPSAAPSRRGSASHRTGGPLARRVSTVFTLAGLSSEASPAVPAPPPIQELWQVVSPVATLAPAASSAFANAPSAGATPQVLSTSSPRVTSSTPTTAAVKDPTLCGRKLTVDSIFEMVIPTLPPQVTVMQPTWM